VGGGTHLEAQAACLDILGVKGPSKPPRTPGENAQQLARYATATHSPPRLCPPAPLTPPSVSDVIGRWRRL
jgi:hypothetical protein